MNAQKTLQEPPTASALATAQQAVTAAQAQLQTAQEARTNLDTNAQTAVATAQHNVQKAQAAATAAQQALTNASENQQIAQGKLANAETAYCATPDPAHPVSFCPGTFPISSADASALVAVTNPAYATLAGDVLTADSGYRAAVTAYQAASNTVTSTQNDLSTANDALTTAEGQPTAAQVAAADSAVSAAQAALGTANYNLSQLQAGPTPGAARQRPGRRRPGRRVAQVGAGEPRPHVRRLDGGADPAGAHVRAAGRGHRRQRAEGRR